MKAKEFEQLLARYVSGETYAFDKIYNEYFHKLVGAAFLILHNKEDAQNAASDIFVKILSNPTAFLNIRNPSGYLFTMTQNYARNLLRHNHQPLGKNGYVYEDDASDDTIARMDFYRLLSQYFSIAEQEILILRCVWDLTYSEIANRVAMPLGTIKSKFRSFKRRLKNVLKKID